VSELVRFDAGNGEWLLVETDDDAVGLDRVGRRDADGVVSASTRLEEAVAQVKPAIRSVLATLRELEPDQHEIEFGIKLSAEAGVVIAKTAVEGHFTVKMSWRGGSAG
jgi:hypothetical protein